MDEGTLFNRLLRAEDELEADRVLRQAGYSLEEPVWRALGDMEK